MAEGHPSGDGLPPRGDGPTADRCPARGPSRAQRCFRTVASSSWAAMSHLRARARPMVMRAQTPPKSLIPRSRRLRPDRVADGAALGGPHRTPRRRARPRCRRRWGRRTDHVGRGGRSSSAIAGAFSRTGSMTIPRTVTSMSRLRDGRVLVVGGQTTPDDRWIPSADVFDSDSASFTMAGLPEDLVVPPAPGRWPPRAWGSPVALRDGRVLLVGLRCQEVQSTDVAFGEGFWETPSRIFDRRCEPVRGRPAVAPLHRDGDGASRRPCPADVVLAPDTARTGRGGPDQHRSGLVRALRPEHWRYPRDRGTTRRALHPGRGPPGRSCHGPWHAGWWPERCRWGPVRGGAVPVNRARPPMAVVLVGTLAVGGCAVTESVPTPPASPAAATPPASTPPTPAW